MIVGQATTSARLFARFHKETPAQPRPTKTLGPGAAPEGFLNKLGMVEVRSGSGSVPLALTSELSLHRLERGASTSRKYHIGGLNFELRCQAIVLMQNVACIGSPRPSGGDMLGAIQYALLVCVMFMSCMFLKDGVQLAHICLQVWKSPASGWLAASCFRDLSSQLSRRIGYKTHNSERQPEQFHQFLNSAVGKCSVSSDPSNRLESF